MVTRAVLVLVACAHAARAESIVIVEEVRVRDGWNLLGTRIAYGSLPIEGGPMTTMALAVAIDRPLAGRWRVLGEYELVSIGERDWEAHAKTGVGSLADSGHCVHAGIRRRLADTQWPSGFGLFVDGEAGVGALLVDRSVGALAVPHAFAGVRAGFGLEEQRRRWDYELVLRGLAVPEGAGLVFGIGFAWGE